MLFFSLIKYSTNCCWAKLVCFCEQVPGDMGHGPTSVTSPLSSDTMGKENSKVIA